MAIENVHMYILTLRININVTGYTNNSDAANRMNVNKNNTIITG